MLMIRLARRGKKNNPVYRVVVSEKGRDLFGDALEIVGTYNPVSKTKDVGLNRERILYWISKGAHVSPTVHNLLISNNITTGSKIAKKSVKAKNPAQQGSAGEQQSQAA